jgi:phenylalanyl-tRNA synthetase beta chain
MAGLEVESVEDSSAKFAPFTAARILEAVQHPNADRLRVCQVDTVQGRLEIVCGAPNARAGLVTVFAPIGPTSRAPGSRLSPGRCAASSPTACSAPPPSWNGPQGLRPSPTASLSWTRTCPWHAGRKVFGTEPVIDFEVTPNRPDWLGVQGFARDLAAAAWAASPKPRTVPGRFPARSHSLDAPSSAPSSPPADPGVRNGPSPTGCRRGSERGPEAHQRPGGRHQYLTTTARARCTPMTPPSWSGPRSWPAPASPRRLRPATTSTRTTRRSTPTSS